jgi:hypothetical protein
MVQLVGYHLVNGGLVVAPVNRIRNIGAAKIAIRYEKTL